MKVLLFANSPLVPRTKNGKNYNNSGWIKSLQEEMQKVADVKIGVCCISSCQEKLITEEGVIYYKVKLIGKSLKEKVIVGFRPSIDKYEIIRCERYVKEFKKVVDDFNPDIIHIFGSEFYYGLITSYITIPIVLHLQGILSACSYAYFPPSVSYWQLMWKDRNLKQLYSNIQQYAYWKRCCKREKRILSTVLHVIGRTAWDKQAMQILNPKARYHYGGEILRPEFYEVSERRIPDKIVLTTTISNPPYKGFDLVLKIAYILKCEVGLEFEWNVFGNVSPKFWERHTGINCKDVNLYVRGVASAYQLREALLKSTLYFHPSYIENSPNSVGEAQILGVPVVATNVGGTSSMVEHGKTGYLFPATDPYMGAYFVQDLISNIDKNIQMGIYSKKVALERHKKETIIEELLDTYKTIIDEHNC